MLTPSSFRVIKRFLKKFQRKQERMMNADGFMVVGANSDGLHTMALNLAKSEYDFEGSWEELISAFDLADHHVLVRTKLGSEIDLALWLEGTL